MEQGRTAGGKEVLFQRDRNILKLDDAVASLICVICVGKKS